MTSLNSLTDLQSYFDDKLQYLHNLLQFRSIDSSHPVLPELSHQLADVEDSLKEILQLPAELDNIRTLLSSLKVYAESQSEYISSIESKLANSFMSRPHSGIQPNSQKPRVVLQSSIQNHQETPQPQSEPVASASLSGSSTQYQQSKSSPVEISFITQTQLDTLPHYLKGRLTVEKINSAVTDLNKILRRKFLIMKKGSKAGSKYREQAKKLLHTEALSVLFLVNLKIVQISDQIQKGKRCLIYCEVLS
ncbi:hypothetical protein GEMRC1_002654 [Eukaryota sp. GEM-RC1]